MISSALSIKEELHFDRAVANTTVRIQSEVLRIARQSFPISRVHAAVGAVSDVDFICLLLLAAVGV